jgi:chitinase
MCIKPQVLTGFEVRNNLEGFQNKGQAVVHFLGGKNALMQFSTGAELGIIRMNTKHESNGLMYTCLKLFKICFEP